MMPYVHILLSDLKTWFFASYTCFVVEVPSLVLARRRRKIFERALDFLHSRRQKQFYFLGVKMVLYIHIFYTACRRRKKFCFFFGVKMVPYILHTDFLHSLPQAKKFGVFGGQNGAIYTHFEFFLGSKCCHIYTFLEFNFFRKNEKKKNNSIGL